MRILITGGSGLLAGRLAKFLSKHNSVTLLSRKNIKNILEADSIYTMHYQNQNDFNQDIIDHDIIIHASSPNAIDSKDINISKRYLEETKTLIDMASISKNVKKFIFLSSIRVVSDNYQGLITENMAVNPSSHYGKLKNEIETYLRVKKSANNMSKIILRITNGYGYPIHNLSDCWNLVVMNICKQAIENGEIKLKSSGQAYKDFIPISTIAKVVNAIAIDENLESTEIFNVSSGKSLKVIDFIMKINEKLEFKLSKKIKISLNNLDNALPASNFAIDNSKIKNRQYMDELDHDEEINKLIDFCINNFK